MKIKKIILPVGVLAVVLTIATIISFVLITYLGSNGMTFNLSSFNWEGVDGITNIFMTVVTLVFLYGIIQAKETILSRQKQESSQPTQVMQKYCVGQWMKWEKEKTILSLLQVPIKKNYKIC